MSPQMTALVAHFEEMSDADIVAILNYMEEEVRHYQMRIAAARKAQKNQKRAAKDRNKVVG